MKINKLVRDRIPEIIERNGKKPICRILDDAEYMEALEKKLDEEITEFHESKSIEELVDILEVVYALARAQGESTEYLQYLQRHKNYERGSFTQKIFLEEVQENV